MKQQNWATIVDFQKNVQHELYKTNPEVSQKLNINVR